MKLTVAWNVWNNYHDLLLGSEIARRQNDEWRCFDALHLISQGGYPEPPSDRERQYTDGHFDVPVEDTHPLLALHVKFRGVIRVLRGLRNAYEAARSAGSDYALVTNGDAWCLDLRRLRALLDEPATRDNAIMARIGLVTGLDLSYGSYVPFFDDHFMILNVRRCAEHRVFDYDEPKAFAANFVEFGGIHYLLGVLMDERVPQARFRAYTHLEDCVNQFGERCAFSLLPWQYQPQYAFLHANAAQEPELHPLRAAMLRHHGLDRFPEVAAYCREHPASPDVAAASDYVYYRQTPAERARIAGAWWPVRTYQRLMRRVKYDRHAAIKRSHDASADALRYYDAYDGVMPMGLASRRRQANAQGAK